MVLCRSGITQSVEYLIVLARKECTLLLNLFGEFGEKCQFDIVNMRKFIKKHKTHWISKRLQIPLWTLFCDVKAASSIHLKCGPKQKN